MNKLFINEMSITIQVDNSKEEILLLEKLSKVVSAIHSSRTKDKYVVSSRYLPEVLSIYRPQYTFDVLPDKIKAIYKSCKEKPLKRRSYWLINLEATMIILDLINAVLLHYQRYMIGLHFIMIQEQVRRQ